MLGTLYFVVVSCLNTCMSKEEVLVDTPTTNKFSSILHVHYCSPRSQESKLAIPFGRLNTIISYLSEGEYLT